MKLTQAGLSSQDVDIFIKSDIAFSSSKGVCLMNAPATLVAYVFSQVNLRSFWDETFDSGSELDCDKVCVIVFTGCLCGLKFDSTQATGIHVSHYVFKAPWPITFRDLVVAGRRIDKPDGRNPVCFCFLE